MIRTLRGEMTHHFPVGVVIEVAGVGYLVAVPARSVPQIGEQVFLFTYQHVREDELALFGFATLAELELFKLLLTVPSIGPKLGLTILSTATPDEIAAAVERDNLGFFQSIPGLGKKGAAKIIVELKGKIVAGREITIPGGGSELYDALVTLGYASAEIQEILKRLPKEKTSLEEQVAWALREAAQV
ncbi:Holliday junction branch migration protein RuvA [Candidatus Berkelbacteria bacterium]|nr:Holliday junction branch migration protein RuvA [Candidatus Berkelbacteria bacterium]